MHLAGDSPYARSTRFYHLFEWILIYVGVVVVQIRRVEVFTLHREKVSHSCLCTLGSRDLSHRDSLSGLSRGPN